MSELDQLLKEQEQQQGQEKKQPESENEKLNLGAKKPLLICNLTEHICAEGFERLNEQLRKFADRAGYDVLIAHPSTQFQVAPSLDGLANAIIAQGNAIQQLADGVYDLIDSLEHEEAEPSKYLDGSDINIPGVL